MMSKLDIAEQRKNSDDRLDFDGDGDESTPGGYGGFYITKGPPDKLDAPPRKLHFLAMFGLTTLAKRNGTSFFVLPFLVFNDITI